MLPREPELRFLKGVIPSVHSGSGRRAVLSVMDIGLTSASAMLLTVIAARTLTVDQFGLLGILLTVVGAVQGIVQGGFIDVLLQKASKSIAGGYWTVERWSVNWLALAMLGAVLTMISGRVHVAGLLAAIIGVGVLVVRHFWVRAFFFTQDHAVQSVLISVVLLATAAAWLLGSAIIGSFDWRLVTLSYATTYALAGTVSYVVGRRLVQDLHPDTHNGPVWHWGYALGGPAAARRAAELNG